MERVRKEQSQGDTPSAETADAISAIPAKKAKTKPAPVPAISLTPTIFHEDWWLAAATNNSFDVVEVTANGRTTGRLPFYVRKRSFYSELRLPPLTYFLGPVIDEGEGSENNRFLKRLDITRELLRKLPKTWSAYIKCHAAIPDAIGFQQESFRTYAQFTHHISPAPADQIWKGMRNKTRNVIRRAEEEFTVEELTDAAEFSSLYDKNLNSKGARNEIDPALSTRVAAAALERQQGRIIVARDKTGAVHAANFCAWDATTSFYIMSTRDGGSGNGATSLLLWDAIKHAAAKGLIFDFAGLGNEGTVLFYSGFGAIVTPRYVAVRTTLPARLLQEVKNLVIPENFYY